ncbi:MAG: hypothetical protein ACLRG2_01430 [Pauljensenia sp.]
MGAENVPANMEVNYYKWKSWIAALREGDDCVAVKLENAAQELQKNVDVQTEGKWGVEAGPVAFQARYTSYLTQEITALNAMAANVREFAKALETAVRALEAGDEDAQANLEATLKTIPSSYVSEEMKAIWEGDTTGSPQIPPDLDF